jgi:hypothetical protein
MSVLEQPALAARGAEELCAAVFARARGARLVAGKKRNLPTRGDRSRRENVRPPAGVVL